MRLPRNAMWQAQRAIERVLESNAVQDHPKLYDLRRDLSQAWGSLHEAESIEDHSKAPNVQR